ncbi:hypothetical protein ACQPYE_28205 [Actinosynnema sp. CA-299493]
MELAGCVAAEPGAAEDGTTREETHPVEREDVIIGGGGPDLLPLVPVAAPRSRTGR